jgi:hypothetical protein
VALLKGSATFLVIKDLFRVKIVKSFLFCQTAIINKNSLIIRGIFDGRSKEYKKEFF